MSEVACLVRVFGGTVFSLILAPLRRAVLLLAAIPFAQPIFAQSSTTYEYDALGWLKRTTYGGSTPIDFSYDPNGNRATVMIDGGAAPDPQSSYDDTAHAVHAMNGLVLQPMQFDEGGQGVVYNDEAGMQGGIATIRTGADVEATGSATDSSGSRSQQVTIPSSGGWRTYVDYPAMTSNPAASVNVLWLTFGGDSNAETSISPECRDAGNERACVVGCNNKVGKST